MKQSDVPKAVELLDELTRLDLYEAHVKGGTAQLVADRPAPAEGSESAVSVVTAWPVPMEQVATFIAQARNALWKRLALDYDVHPDPAPAAIEPAIDAAVVADQPALA